MLARKIADAGLCEFRRQLEYNAKLNGAELVIASRWFPSGKMCSVCGRIVEDLPLSAREWTCQCGALHDLEINTAKMCCYALARVSCTPKERLWRGRLWRWSYSQRETSLVEAGISLVLNGHGLSNGSSVTFLLILVAVYAPARPTMPADVPTVVLLYE